ncbi:hypothetical protein DM02DRAFT_663850 [Periconia macrospinosa]|uniref:DUF6570 domain-containing protein n=1 Tax=Periconia macrospinosa TaxID=97972 RepID=A0A2V1D0L2_9PLEO|nr:hypothetical protein DM02DRAFT_663850 [Periconia macrospinosa]
MSGERPVSEALPQLFHSYDVRNRQNVARANLGIRTSADIFEASQREHEQANMGGDTTRRRTRGEPSGERQRRSGENHRLRGEELSEHFELLDAYNRQNVARAGLGIRTSADIFQSEHERAMAGRNSGRRRVRRSGDGPVAEQAQQQPKRRRTITHRERRDGEQLEDIANVLSSLDEEFAEKERLSDGGAWCAPISQDRKVSTVREFYKAFHDVSTLPIRTCMLCYRKFAEEELERISWEQWMASAIPKQDGSPFMCRRCFLTGEPISGCSGCVRELERGMLTQAGQLHRFLGCEHMFPDELKGLSPVEEKLIALNSCYGFITKYSIPEGSRRSVTYPKHIKGHITVFPNNVQELATNVLPHPLLTVMDDIHVSWQGPEKPLPSDLSVLLSVRRRVVEKALVWLKRHNPLYANIDIDIAELESWEAPPHGVPCQIYDRLERNEPSAWDKARTGHVVPPTERGLEEERPVDVEKVLAMLSRGRDIAGDDQVDVDGDDDDDEADVPEQDSGAVPVHEISSSGMFALDAGPDVADAEKLRYACEALGEDALGEHTQGSTRVGSAQVRSGNGPEPYILVSRGDDFADSLDPQFFAKAFPTLFPFGNGGPRQAEEAMADVARGEEGAVDADATLQSLVSSRNISLETWARLVLQRHGGRFANHHVFAFLVFNMGVT